MSWASRHNLLARTVNRSLGGVPVLWGAVSGEGIYEQNARVILDDDVISVEHALHNLPTALFGGLKYDDVLIVAGQSFKIREPFRIGDGAYMMVTLSEPGPPAVFEPEVFVTGVFT